MVRTSLVLHPLTPPSSKERVAALLPAPPTDEHEKAYANLVAFLQLELVNVPSAHAFARAVATA